MLKIESSLTQMMYYMFLSLNLFNIFHSHKNKENNHTNAINT